MDRSSKKLHKTKDLQAVGSWNKGVIPGREVNWLLQGRGQGSIRQIT